VHGCLSLVSVVCCQVEASATGLITRPEESYRVSECNRETSIMWRAWRTMGLLRHGKKEMCVLSVRGLCVGAEHSPRGVLSSVLSVIVKPRKYGKPGPLWGYCAMGEKSEP